MWFRKIFLSSKLTFDFFVQSDQDKEMCMKNSFYIGTFLWGLILYMGVHTFIFLHALWRRILGKDDKFLGKFSLWRWRYFDEGKCSNQSLQLHWDWISLLLLCILFILIPIRASHFCKRHLLSFFPTDPNERKVWIIVTSQTVQFLALWIFLTCTPFISRTFNPGHLTVWESFKKGLKSLYLILPVIFVVNFLWSFFLLFLKTCGLPIQDSPQAIIQLLSTIEQPLCLFAIGLNIVLWAPICEEILFRGILYRFLNARYGSNKAFVSSSFLFAALHNHLFSFMPLFVLGLWLAYVYQKYGDLKVNIWMHSLFNGLNFFLLCF